jgi:hypothetical protein
LARFCTTQFFYGFTMATDDVVLSPVLNQPNVVANSDTSGFVISPGPVNQPLDGRDTSGTDTPVTPETPRQPETPVTPETPRQPETPVTPETPRQPETPVTPETPRQPETPETPTQRGTGFTTNGPSREFNTLPETGSGFSAEIKQPVGGSNYRPLPEGGINFAVPITEDGKTTGFAQVQVRALSTAPLVNLNLGVNQQIIGGPNNPGDPSVSLNVTPLTVGYDPRAQKVTGQVGDSYNGGVVLGGTVEVNARLPLGENSAISARTSGTINYLTGALGAEGTLQGNLKVGQLSGFGDLNLAAGVTAGVAQGKDPSAIVFLGVQAGGGNTKVNPYEVVTETTINSPTTTKETALGNIVINNPGPGENLKPGFPVAKDGAVNDAASKPLLTVQQKDENVSTTNAVSYVYRFGFDRNPLDNKPGLTAEIASDKRLEGPAIELLRKAVQRAEGMDDPVKAQAFLEKGGFTNIGNLPLNPPLDQAIANFKVAQNEVNNPVNYKEVVTNLGTIFASQDGKTIRINKDELSLPPGTNPSTEERMGVFNRSTLVTNPDEINLYKGIVFKAFEKLNPQPSGVPVDKQLPDGTNNGRDKTVIMQPGM